MTFASFKPLALLAVLAAGSVHAETTACTAIQALPTVITTSGIYCLKGDLLTSMSSGIAIEIAANFVTLDLNGWRIGGGAAGTGTTAIGIHAINRRGITIRNGSIKGFLTGISLDGTPSTNTSHTVEAIRADGNLETGIYLSATNSIVRDSQITNTGGSTAATGANKAGIYVNWGDAIAILNNDIDFVTGGSTTAGGIWCNPPNAMISNNRIAHVTSETAAIGLFIGTQSFARGNQISSLAGPYSAGIASNDGSDSVIADNQIIGAAQPGSVGISFNSAAAFRNNVVVGFATGILSVQGVYSGNVVLGATTAYQGGTLHGTTNSP